MNTPPKFWKVVWKKNPKNIVSLFPLLNPGWPRKTESISWCIFFNAVNRYSNLDWLGQCYWKEHGCRKKMLRLKSFSNVGAGHPVFSYMTLWASLPEALEKWVHVLSGSLTPGWVVLHVHRVVGPRHGAHRAKAPGHLRGSQPTVSFQGETPSLLHL